jgi:acetyl-CoA carboxylase biotin carboxyl carrier protein
MTDRADELAAIERAVVELLPSLTERLARHGLGEIEVRQGDLRLRVAAGRNSAASSAAGSESEPAQAGTAPGPAGLPAAVPSDDGRAADAVGEALTSPLMPVTSPAVGYFVYADGLGPGLSVERGAALGYVDVLGVRHQVRAPRTGTVRSLTAESGEAVEYGQPLLEVEAGS